MAEDNKNKDLAKRVEGDNKNKDLAKRVEELKDDSEGCNI
jgi:hypothetical protein